MNHEGPDTLPAHLPGDPAHAERRCPGPRPPGRCGASAVIRRAPGHSRSHPNQTLRGHRDQRVSHQHDWRRGRLAPQTPGTGVRAGPQRALLEGHCCEQGGGQKGGGHKRREEVRAGGGRGKAPPPPTPHCGTLTPLPGRVPWKLHPLRPEEGPALRRASGPSPPPPAHHPLDPLPAAAPG